MEVRAYILNYLEGIKEIPGDSEVDKYQYNFVDSGHIDSFGILQLIMTVEKEFAVRFEAAHLQSEEIRTIDGMSTVIEALKG